MALNVYDSEQVVHFDPNEPSRYFGFYVTWSGDSQDVYPFNSAEQREAFVQAVGHAKPFPQGEEYKGRELAALVALETLGTEWQREALCGQAAEHFPGRDEDDLCEIAREWIEANL